MEPRFSSFNTRALTLGRENVNKELSKQTFSPVSIDLLNKTHSEFPE